MFPDTQAECDICPSSVNATTFTSYFDSGSNSRGKKKKMKALDTFRSRTKEVVYREYDTM